jgi:hypothetical protein
LKIVFIIICTLHNTTGRKLKSTAKSPTATKSLVAPKKDGAPKIQKVPEVSPVLSLKSATSQPEKQKEKKPASDNPSLPSRDKSTPSKDEKPQKKTITTHDISEMKHDFAFLPDTVLHVSGLFICIHSLFYYDYFNAKISIIDVVPDRYTPGRCLATCVSNFHASPGCRRCSSCRFSILHVSPFFFTLFWLLLIVFFFLFDIIIYLSFLLAAIVCLYIFLSASLSLAFFRSFRLVVFYLIFPFRLIIIMRIASLSSDAGASNI